MTLLDQRFDLLDRLVGFTFLIIDLVDQLHDSRVGNHVAGQLLRSGTAPAPNYAEAQSAESRRDFVHKLKVALKELRETEVWLRIIRRKELIVGEEMSRPSMSVMSLLRFL